MSESRSLLEIGAACNTDKVGHGYLEHYENVFAPLREKRVRLLEIGIMEGASLRMWRDYFPRGFIFGVDVVQTCVFEEERIKCFCGAQENEAFMRTVVTEAGPLDIVIDDGSHRGKHHVATFGVLWPLVKDGGWYCIEDCQSIFNECWTLPGDPTMVDLVACRVPAILTGRDTIREVRFVGNWIYSGLIMIRKEAVRPDA